MAREGAREDILILASYVYLHLPVDIRHTNFYTPIHTGQGRNAFVKEGEYTYTYTQVTQPTFWKSGNLPSCRHPHTHERKGGLIEGLFG